MRVTGKPPPRASACGGPGPSQYGGFVGSNPTVYTILQHTEAQMKKALVLILVLISTTVLAKPDWRDPNAMYDAKDNMTNDTQITIIPAKDVNAVCNVESKKRGLGGFNYGVDACSFWDKKRCTIVLPQRFTKERLGHEMLHCLQGDYH